MLELFLNSITLPVYHQHEAIVWFIPIIAAAILFAAWIYATSDETVTTSLKGESLGVMGMPEAGKTQLLMSLQGKSYSHYQQTSVDDYEGFTFEIGNRPIEIKSGKDIGGSEYNISAYYKKFLEDKDICIFLFDVQRYKDDQDYRLQTNARLDFINQHVKEWPAGCAIIGTHVDKAEIKEGENIIIILQKLIAGKPYARLFSHNFFAYNLTDKKDIEKLKEKLFCQKEREIEECINMIITKS